MNILVPSLMISGRELGLAKDFAVSGLNSGVYVHVGS